VPEVIALTQAEADIERIVVGVDGSDASKAALRWAARIGAATGASIEAVTAWEYPRTYGWAVDLGDWQPAEEAEKDLRQTLDETFGEHRPSGLAAVVTRGHARDVLLSASEGADMLVVGSRGHGGFVGLLLGSVSSACTEHAHCPVLVVRGADH
jgi:nucleotide-binding universal stress UspA family protein